MKDKDYFNDSEDMNLILNNIDKDKEKGKRLAYLAWSVFENNALGKELFKHFEEQLWIPISANNHIEMQVGQQNAIKWIKQLIISHQKDI